MNQNCLCSRICWWRWNMFLIVIYYKESSIGKCWEKSLCDRIKQPLWTTTKSHTAEPSGLSVSNFVRKWCADFHSGHISLHSYQQWINIFASVNAGQHELSCVYWSWQIWLVKIKSQNCLICISLSTKDIDHFFKLWWIGLVVFVCWC